MLFRSVFGCPDCYVDPHNGHVSYCPLSVYNPFHPSHICLIGVPCSCDLRDGTFVSLMELSSSQKETKETFEEQDSRGGGLPCPDETSVWRFLKEPGIGDCRKSPKMGHWQQDEGLEL